MSDKPFITDMDGNKREFNRPPIKDKASSIEVKVGDKWFTLPANVKDLKFKLLEGPRWDPYAPWLQPIQKHTVFHLPDKPCWLCVELMLYELGLNARNFATAYAEGAD